MTKIRFGMMQQITPRIIIVVTKPIFTILQIRYVTRQVTETITVYLNRHIKNSPILLFSNITVNRLCTNHGPPTVIIARTVDSAMP